MRFNEWLQRRDPELAEGVKRQLGRLAAVGLPIASSIAGGTAGFFAGGIPGAAAGFMGGKYLGRKASEKWLPQGTLDAMKKMKKR